MSCRKKNNQCDQCPTSHSRILSQNRPTQRTYQQRPPLTKNLISDPSSPFFSQKAPKPPIPYQRKPHTLSAHVITRLHHTNMLYYDRGTALEAGKHKRRKQKWLDTRGLVSKIWIYSAGILGKTAFYYICPCSKLGCMYITASWATPKRGCPSPQLEGPHQSVGIHNPQAAQL